MLTDAARWGVDETMQPVVRRIELRDRGLGRQLRRAVAALLLDVAEGMYSRGRNRQVRYHSALGSARETLACLELALGKRAKSEIPIREIGFGLESSRSA